MKVFLQILSIFTPIDNKIKSDYNVPIKRKGRY